MRRGDRLAWSLSQPLLVVSAIPDHSRVGCPWNYEQVDQTRTAPTHRLGGDQQARHVGGIPRRDAQGAARVTSICDLLPSLARFPPQYFLSEGLSVERNSFKPPPHIWVMVSRLPGEISLFRRSCSESLRVAGGVCRLRSEIRANVVTFHLTLRLARGLQPQNPAT